MKKNYFDKKVSITEFEYLPSNQKFVKKTMIKEIETCDGDEIISSEIQTNSFTRKPIKEKVIHTGKETIVIIEHYINGKPRTFKGVASCCRKDTYDMKRGIQIAYNRAKIKALEAELEELCE